MSADTAIVVDAADFFDRYWAYDVVNERIQFIESVANICREAGFKHNQALYAAIDFTATFRGGKPCVRCSTTEHKMSRRYHLLDYGSDGLCLGCRKVEKEAAEIAQKEEFARYSSEAKARRLSEAANDEPIEYDTTTMRYRDYLQTDEWQVRRAAALRNADNRCQVCNSGGRLNVHHRTYERRGIELESDLTVLCADCHELFHQHGKLVAA